ncbi:18502_t:CDS:2 [Acaulospora morrowiae]|uniref:18502_t:CDS:1 n=1 Tax=Acaulospora morrowiae TaxID=94023 RepID=A0A9N8WLJ7_9GLOM|nr:18502_t:CDS:2 [Acaulospora morrowiae]
MIDSDIREGNNTSNFALDGSVDPTQLNENEDIFVVEKIISHKRKRDGTLRYLIKWEGFGPEQNSWEDANDVQLSLILSLNPFYATELVENYWESRQKKRRNSKKFANDGEDQGIAISAGNIGDFGVDNNTTDSPRNEINVPQWTRDINKPHQDSLTVKSQLGDRQISPVETEDWETKATIGNVFVDDDTGELVIWINWNDGTNSYHGANEVHKRCPCKVEVFSQSLTYPLASLTPSSPHPPTALACCQRMTQLNAPSRPPFPPRIVARDLANTMKVRKCCTAFLAYRLSCSRMINAQSPTLSHTAVSTIASFHWSRETRRVKEAYKLIAIEASDIIRNERG